MIQLKKKTVFGHRQIETTIKPGPKTWEKPVWLPTTIVSQKTKKKKAFLEIYNLISNSKNMKAPPSFLHI